MITAYLARRLGGLLLAVCFTAGLAVLPPVGMTTQAEAAVVNRILVEGNQRVDEETVRAYLTIQPGRQFTAEDVNESLIALFETGLFANVSIDQRGGALVVTVQENPIINQIAFEGNRHFRDEQLSTVIESRPRGVFTRAGVQNDVRRLLELYRRQGRFQAAIVPRLIDLPQNRVNLVFEITEGPTTNVSRINFIGNRAYGDARLRNVIETRESGLLSFLRTGDSYDPDRLAADEERLRRFYRSRGYADFQILSTVADLDRERNAFFITFTLDEGPLYRFGIIEVDSIVPGIDPEALRRLAVSRPGNVFSSAEVEESLEAMTIALAEQGYAFAQVRPRIDRNPEALTIDITYVVDEGPRAYVERINIRGNTRTRDYVIRREFDIAEGDAFNRVLLDRAERRLNNLGFFENVRITSEPGSAPDRVIVNVTVEEKATGEFSFGAGWSNADGIVGDISLVERNFLGRGYNVRVSFGGGETTRNFEFAFTDPFFLGRRVSGGFRVYRQTADRDEDRFRPYSFKQSGGGVSLGLPITEEFQVVLGYNLEHQEVDIAGLARDPTRPFNCPRSVSLAVCEVEGDSINSSVSYSLIYDTLDNSQDPRDGIFARFTQEFAGVGGDVNYLRSTASASVYREVWPDQEVVGLLRVQGGHITGMSGERVRLVDAFFRGGETVRGFKARGFGPRDMTPITFFDENNVLQNTGVPVRSALGGNVFAAATAELQFPLPLMPRELGFRGALFADAGTLFDTDATVLINANCPAGPPTFGNCVVDEDWALRSSVGASILWASPLGPLRADFAYVLSKEDFDETQWFRIGGGGRF
jgi:outer membrane protein insertion porin family